MPSPKLRVRIWNKVHEVKSPVWTAQFNGGTCAVCTYFIRKGEVLTRNQAWQIVHHRCVNVPKSSNGF